MLRKAAVNLFALPKEKTMNILKTIFNSKTKTVFASVILLCMSFCLYARDAIYKSEAYDISLFYNDNACPGDAVFIRLVFTDNVHKSKKQVIPESSARAALFLGDKEIASSDFYELANESTRTVTTLLTGIPLSSWWQENNYHITVTYSFQGQRKMKFNLPFVLTPKEFVSETIEFDTKNTNIKTDTSSERMQQIEKLNLILETINKDAVYQTQAFVPPTDATRRTSFFADRRIYAYSNGKSSTSLHYGIDYGIPTGSSVTSCADGKVVLAETRVSTGWSVVIEHLPGLYSLYYHMDSLNVKEGDIVKQGDLIGLSGATGLATGPHLHWEMRLNTQAVSPDFFTDNFTFAQAEQ